MEPANPAVHPKGRPAKAPGRLLLWPACRLVQCVD